MKNNYKTNKNIIFAVSCFENFELDSTLSYRQDKKYLWIKGSFLESF